MIEQAIFGEEMARAKAPSPANVLGMVMGGPVVIHHGSDEQKERWLRPILTGDEIWCQGFSEPESGSDLASLKTQGGQEQRRMGGHRPEGVDHVRAQVEVVHAGGPHRPGRPQAPGPHLLHHGHGAGGRAGAAAAPDHAPAGVQRAVHRGGADPRRERGRRGGQRLGRGHHHADERARRPGRGVRGRGPDRARRAAASWPASAAWPTTRWSASGSASSHRGRSCFASTPGAGSPRS